MLIIKHFPPKTSAQQDAYAIDILVNYSCRKRIVYDLYSFKFRYRLVRDFVRFDVCFPNEQRTGPFSELKSYTFFGKKNTIIEIHLSSTLKANNDKL